MCQLGVHRLSAVYLCKVCIETECFLLDLHILFSHMTCGDVANASVLIRTTLQGFPFADRISRAKDDSD